MDHIIQNTFGFAAEKYIQDWMHYKGFDSLPDIVMDFLEDPWRLQDQTSYKKDGTTHELQQATISKVRVLVMWIKDWIQKNHHMFFPKVGYINISKQNFDLWHVNHALQPQETPYFSRMKSPTKSPTGSASTVTHGSHLSSASYVSLKDFKKRTKRDTSSFDAFKDEQYYDVFHHGFTATARVQGLANICDPM